MNENFIQKRNFGAEDVLHGLSYLWDPRAIIAFGTTSTLVYGWVSTRAPKETLLFMYIPVF